MSYYGDLIESGTLATFSQESGKLEAQLRAGQDVLQEAEALIERLRVFKSNVGESAGKRADGIVYWLQLEMDRFTKKDAS